MTVQFRQFGVSLAFTPVVLATGGMAELIAPYAPSLSHIEPHLTLEGLRLIHARCHHA